VLVIPGKALRFTPDATWLADYMKNNPIPPRQGSGGTRTGGQNPNYQRSQNTGTPDQSITGQFQSANQSGKKPVIVWVKKEGKFHRTRVVTGAIDGSNSEIKSGLQEGDEVVLSMSLPGKSAATVAAAPAQNTSPFMPTRPGGRGR
jgi:hypothetical protein